MPLDPLIANPSVVKLADPVEQFGNVLKNAYLANQVAEAKQKRSETDAMNDAYKMPGAVNPDGTLNDDIVVNAFAQKGRGSMIPSFQANRAKIAKDQADAKKTEAEIGETRAKMDKTQMEAFANALKTSNEQLSGVAMDPHVGQDQYYAHIVANSKDPLISKWLQQRGVTPDQYIQDEVGKMHAASQSPESWKQFVVGEATSGKDMEAMLSQKIEQLDLGGHKQLVSVDTHNPNATPKVMSDQTVTASPNVARMTVNNYPENKGETKLYEANAEAVSKEYSALRAQAQAAPKTFASAQNLIGLLNKGAMTGAGSDFATKALAWADTAGLNINHDKLVASQEFRKYLKQNIFDMVGAMKNAGVPISRITNMELQLVEQGAPNSEMNIDTVRSLLKHLQEDSRNAVINHNSRLGELLGNQNTRGAMSMFAAHPFDIPGIPPQAIEFLKKNNDAKHQQLFEKKYGLPSGAASSLFAQPQQPGGGGAPTGGVPFDPRGGTAQWMPIVNKYAPSYGVDPALVQLIMDKESGGKPNAHNGANNNGSWDHGLMQVNSVHGFTTKQLDDPDFNIKQGIAILAGSLRAHPGDLRAGIKGYNGSGPAADAYAADILSRYKGSGLVRK